MPRILISGLIGAALILAFTFGALLLLMNGLSVDYVLTTDNTILKIFIYAMVPIAGGFVAGLVDQSRPHQAGFFAGLFGGLFYFLIILASAGLSWPGIGSGLVLAFVWVFLARLGGGFASSGKHTS